MRRNGVDSVAAAEAEEGTETEGGKQHEASVAASHPSRRRTILDLV